MGRRDKGPPWTMNFNLPSLNTGKDGENREENNENDGNKKGPPKVVNTVPSSS